MHAEMLYLLRSDRTDRAGDLANYIYFHYLSIRNAKVNAIRSACSRVTAADNEREIVLDPHSMAVGYE